MSIRRGLEWVAIFGILTTFTLWVGVAYAQPSGNFLANNLPKHQAGLVVYYEEKIGTFDRAQLLCDINVRQLAALQAHYKVTLEQKTLGGQIYTVATVQPS